MRIFELKIKSCYLGRQKNHKNVLEYQGYDPNTMDPALLALAKELT